MFNVLLPMVCAVACFSIAMIWLSVYREFFMQNLLRIHYEKIVLLSTATFRGDYQSIHVSLSLWLPTSRWQVSKLPQMWGFGNTCDYRCFSIWICSMPASINVSP